jgi:class 3 adenylate cyclase
VVLLPIVNTPQLLSYIGMSKKENTSSSDLGTWFYKSVARQIRRSRKPITILFTDVVGSTRYWDVHGDVKGRLMIDLHNRLIYPVIRRHRGKVIKHIGDAIMVSFRSPENGLKAAIGIQQILEERRKQDKDFRLKVRIGLHTGEALVENKDVFGDTVNLAARLERCARGDEICVSGDTAERLDEEHFGLAKTGSILPKGKRSEVTIYKCEWRKYPSLIDEITEDAFFRVLLRQKFELLAYFLAFQGMLFFLFFKYLRYLLADNENLALLTLKLQSILDLRIAIPFAMAVLAMATAIFFFRTKSIPHFALRFLKGVFGFTLGFMLLFIPTNYFHLDLGLRLNDTLYQSHHLFVEVLEDKAGIHEMPSETSPIIYTANDGTILLLADVIEREVMKWNKVLVGKKRYGWIPRIMPAKIGVPEIRLSISNKFYFRYRDLYGFIIGSVGFIWGALSFRFKPG